MNGQVKTQEPSGCAQNAKVPTGTEKRRFTIYKVINQVNGKIYIGQTVETLRERKSAHFRKCERGSRYCFHNAIRKHGPDAFIWGILCLCLSKAEADAKESEFIKAFKAKVPSGYNMTDGGEGTLGCSPSKETREKLRKANLGKIGTFLGRKHTAESRAKITAVQLGKKRGPHSAEHNEKIRNALKGRTITEEQKAMISKTLTGRRLSPEQCAASGKAHIGLKRSDEIRANMVKVWIARKEKSPTGTGQGYLKLGLPDYKGRVQP
jgi:group I intron endonuclease